ncbi:MAG: glutamine--fructose-6-phosphate transaminase (isomerizing), partial [Candidatus Omnitrophica bacterium]|nr:glutamine--fructose-6-phosphate transaminase (isomerizing) [Candidatus Omnitrophota bacterium]
MCGIFGYVGEKVPLASLIEGLERLEYRGYDSCGLAVIKNKKFFSRKRSGKIRELKKELNDKLKEDVSIGILHTRWATHGRPTTINAHPHFDCQKNIAVVHNGIIENFHAIKEELLTKGHRFVSETDSEVIAHLIESFYQGSLEEAVIRALEKLHGSFALGVLSLFKPDDIIVARKASPLIIGLGKKGKFLASDIPAMLPFTRRVIYLKDKELAVINKDKVEIFDFKKKTVKLKVEKVTLEAAAAQKKGFEHFMLKEIFEQPEISEKIISLYIRGGKIHFPAINISENFLKRINKIYITACGTAYHAGYGAKYFLEKNCDIEVQIDTSSEFRYRRMNLDKKDLLIAISQSGETADTLAAVDEAKKKGATILSICNVLGSSLFKESNGIIATLAGPEIGVASTKAYTAQLLALYLFSLYLGFIKGNIKNRELTKVLKDLRQMPYMQKRTLESIDRIKKIAKIFSKFGSFLFLGRGLNYPLALEGALKLKEISYIPAEGYPAGEMKHGPIALIDEYRAVVCIA